MIQLNRKIEKLLAIVLYNVFLQKRPFQQIIQVAPNFSERRLLVDSVIAVTQIIESHRAM
eukprot:m.315648 g.315648  ORF g.315648 m.315648 type:complete len:60 (+) comp745276_c0_seq1:74-253(+)